MKDKITKKKVKRFDYYSFLIDRHLFGEFCLWCVSNNFDKNSYKVRHNFLVSKNLFKGELGIVGNPYYDRDNVISPGEFVSKTNLIAICKETPYL